MHVIKRKSQYAAKRHGLPILPRNFVQGGFSTRFNRHTSLKSTLKSIIYNSLRYEETCLPGFTWTNYSQSSVLQNQGVKLYLASNLFFKHGQRTQYNAMSWEYESVL